MTHKSHCLMSNKEKKHEKSKRMIKLYTFDWRNFVEGSIVWCHFYDVVVKHWGWCLSSFSKALLSMRACCSTKSKKILKTLCFFKRDQSDYILKWYHILGYFRTSDFFRKFSSESHRILFLGKLLGVFSVSVGNSGMMIFQG